MQPIHLCIGAPRSGTTWLFNNLIHQQGIFVPCVKEVRYWYGARSDADARRTSELRRIEFADHPDREMQFRWLDRWEAIGADHPRSGRAYSELMSTDRPSIDLSPIYSVMPRHRIAKVAEAVPSSSQVLYILRDPVERFLSQARLHFHLHGSYRGTAPLSAYRELLDLPIQQRRSDYLANIENWRSAFGDRLHIVYNDDIDADPIGVLRRLAGIFQFQLDEAAAARTATGRYGTEKVKKASHHPAAKVLTARTLLPQIESFAAAFPEPGKQWLASARKFAARPSDDGIPPTQALPADVEKLMRLCESLGDNCEYGMWQRQHGYEPSSLFRWAITPIDALCDFLEKPNATPLYDLPNLKPHSRNLVSDLATGFKFHSKLVEQTSDGQLTLLSDEAERHSRWKDEKEKFDFLKSRFLQMLRKPGIFIVKRNAGLSEAQVMRLGGLISSYRTGNQLVWVRQGESQQIERWSATTLIAEIPSFAPMVAAHACDDAGWTRIMTSLLKVPEVEHMVGRMSV